MRLRLGEGGVDGGQNLVRYDTEQLKSLAFEATPGELGDVIHLVDQNLVKDDTDDFDAFLLEERLVESHLVDGFADPAA